MEFHEMSGVRKGNLTWRYLAAIGLLLLALGGLPQQGLANDMPSGRALLADNDPEGFDESFEEDDPFDQVDTSIPDEAEHPKDQGPLTIKGFVALESEVAYDKSDEKLSKLTPQLFVEAEYKINENVEAKVSGMGHYDFSYDISAKDRYNGTAQDDEPYGLELRDAYLDGILSERVSFRLGRQIIAWGDSDYARITDVVNPRDLTSPGLIDLEDARLPVAAARLTVNTDPWVWEAVTVHEHPGSKISGEGGDFDYYKRLRMPTVRISDKDTPGIRAENTGVAMKTTYAFNGGDISFVGASTFDHRPVLKYDGMSGGVVAFTPEYERFTTLGLSSTLARGSILYKMETAFLLDQKMMRNDVLPQIASGLPKDQVRTVTGEDRVSALAGVEYTGITDLRLVLEAQIMHTLNYSNTLSADENEFATYFQATRDFYNETLEVDLFWVTLHPGSGNILRLSAAWDVTDSWQIRAGLVFYDAASSSTDLYAYTDQDRVFLRLKYSF